MSEFRPDELRAPTIQADGSRKWLYPDRRKGIWTSRRRILGWALVAFYLTLPFLTRNDRPLLRFDADEGIAWFLGFGFRFTDTSYLVYLMLAFGFGVAFVTSYWGRIWCGMACPQTVLTEWIIRPIEEFWEGPAHHRRRADSETWTTTLIGKKLAKHLSFVLIILLISHSLLAFFVEPGRIWNVLAQSPSEHMGLFAMVLSVFLILYLDLVWFREQFCSFVCPYARFQALLISDATPTITYDAKRGEPRGKKSQSGDCIDCGLCTRVCPTGIDIRDGLQLECIQCFRCVDACHSIMSNLNRKVGLIRLMSLREASGQGKASYLRPRPLIYLGGFLVSLLVMGWSMRARDPVEVEVLRQERSTFVVQDDGRVSNYFRLRVTNNSAEKQELEIRAQEGIELLCTACSVLLPGEERQGLLVITFDSKLHLGALPLRINGRYRQVPLLFP